MLDDDILLTSQTINLMPAPLEQSRIQNFDYREKEQIDSVMSTSVAGNVLRRTHSSISVTSRRLHLPRALDDRQHKDDQQQPCSWD